VRAKLVILIVLGLVASGAIALGVGLLLFLPDYIEREAMRQMRERGLELDSYELEFGWGWVTIENARGRLVGVSSLSLSFEKIEVQLEGSEPKLITLSGLGAEARGSAPTIAVELAAWSKRFPATYALPLSASRVTVSWLPEPGVPWLEVKGGTLAKTAVSTVFNADTVSIQGKPVG
jgi:hypothetical protein